MPASRTRKPALVTLTGNDLTIEDLARIARDPAVQVRVAPSAVARVRNCRRMIDQIVHRYRKAVIRKESPLPHVYGITTGFGEFKNAPIPVDQLETIQQNILLSHATGVGDSLTDLDPVSYFPAAVVRATLVLRLNAFLKGFSGVRTELVECICAMINRGIIPLVPTKGSVGSSGDLCPLSHMFVILLGDRGQGRYYVVESVADMEMTGLAPASSGSGRLPAGIRAVHRAAALSDHLGFSPPLPSFKEGLALTNGANLSAAMLALAVHDAAILADTADLVSAMTLESVCGRTRALSSHVHDARGMEGQKRSAANLRLLLAGSTLTDGADEVQDAYSIRCAPQVHGATRDALTYVRSVAEAEVNAATDNPLFFPDLKAHWDTLQRRARGDDRDALGDLFAVSQGNFHGQPVAMAADVLAIAVAELANVAERRIQLLLDGHHNRNLPRNLVPMGGLNSGFMIAQYAAASLVSENKVFAHPACVDSIPTSANSEDHVAMATHAARKAQTILANTEAVLAIELMIAAQALEWRVGLSISPNLPSNANSSGSDFWEQSQVQKRRFESAVSTGGQREIARRLAPRTRPAYSLVRRLVPPLLTDRPLDQDIRELRLGIRAGLFAAMVLPDR